MIPNSQYPLTLGGKSFQKEYRGFDIAVIIKQGEGVRTFIVSSDGNIFFQTKRNFAKIDECFSNAEKLIDKAITTKSIHDAAQSYKERDKLKQKCFNAAISAMANAITLSKGDISRLKSFYEYELKQKLNGI